MYHNNEGTLGHTLGRWVGLKEWDWPERLFLHSTCFYCLGWSSSLKPASHLLLFGWQVKRIYIAREENLSLFFSGPVFLRWRTSEISPAHGGWKRQSGSKWAPCMTPVSLHGPLVCLCFPESILAKSTGVGRVLPKTWQLFSKVPSVVTREGCWTPQIPQRATDLRNVHIAAAVYHRVEKVFSPNPRWDIGKHRHLGKQTGIPKVIGSPGTVTSIGGSSINMLTKSFQLSVYFFLVSVAPEFWNIIKCEIEQTTHRA